jgi:hypothetical protein
MTHHELHKRDERIGDDGTNIVGVPTAPIYPADELLWTAFGHAVCPNCRQACHESHLHTVNHGAGITGCDYCTPYTYPDPERQAS